MKKSFLLALILCSVFLINIKSEASVTSLTTEVPDTVLMDVDICGDGAVIIDDQMYRAHSQITIKRDSEVTIMVEPDSGWSLSKIVLNGQDLVLDEAGCIVSLDFESNLVVSFEKNSSKELPVKTGDSSNYFWVWFAILIVNASAIIVLCIKLKKQNQEYLH